MYKPLTCPNCGTPEPVCSRTEGARRWRCCPVCQFTFTTLEEVESAANVKAFQASMFKALCQANAGAGPGLEEA